MVNEVLQNELKEVLDLEKKMLPYISGDAYGALRHIIGLFKVVLENSDDIILYNTDRQYAIEIHSTGLPITLEAHDRYHETSEKLSNAIRNFCINSKILMNSITVFLAKLVPEADRRGLKTQSFGVCINSMDMFKFNDENLEKLRKLFCGLGRRIDDNIFEYRDKHIEHDRELETGFLSTGVDECCLTHSGYSIGYAEPPKFEIDKKKVYITSINTITEDGKNSIHFHVRPSVYDGDSVKEGDVIGQNYDSTGTHFYDYGIHSHLFYSHDMNFQFPLHEMIHNEKNEDWYKTQNFYISIQQVNTFVIRCFNIMLEYANNRKEQ